MKKKIKLISGLAASFLLAVGLHAAAEKLDPISSDLERQIVGAIPTDADEGPIMPCKIGN